MTDMAPLPPADLMLLDKAVHAAVLRALNEAGVRNEVLRGMCLEVALETASECFVAAARDAALRSRTLRQAMAAAGFTRRPSLRAREMRAALELIAAPMRPDGTWNRDREACRELAAEALGRYDEDSA